MKYEVKVNKEKTEVNIFKDGKNLAVLADGGIFYAPEIIGELRKDDDFTKAVDEAIKIAWENGI